MRALKISLLALSMLTLSSCKKEGKDEAQDEAAVEVKKNFWVELDVEASQKDDFALYFTEDNTVNFAGDKAVWHGVKGGERETISLELDESRIPTDIRLDFGLNKNQEKVSVYNIKVAYQDKDFTIKGSDFFTFFIENKEFTTSVDAAKGALVITKNGAEYKTPYFYPTQKLIDEIKKLTTVKPE